MSGWSGQSGSNSNEWSAAFSQDDDDDENDVKMKGYESNKDAVLFLIDCRTEMLAPGPGDDGGSRFQDVLTVAVNMLKTKIVSDPGDKVGIVFYNTKVTKNTYDFTGVNYFMNLEEPSAANIQRLQNLYEPEDFEAAVGSKTDGECEVHNALWTCSHVFSDAALKDTSMRVFIVTDNDMPNEGEYGLREKAVQKAEDMKEIGINCRMFAMGSESTFNNAKYWQVVLPKSPEHDSGASESFNTLEELDEEFKKRNIKKRALASVPLQIAPGISINIKLYVMVRMATREPGGWLDHKTNEPLTTMTAWICKETGLLLEPYQISKYFPYGGTKVFFKPEEMTHIKTFGDPGLTMMGFKPMSTLKDYYNMKGSYFVFPDEAATKGSNVAFNAIVQEMANLQVYGVCRMIYRKSGGPKFVALLPQVEKKDKEGRLLQPTGMHMIFLPYAEDIRSVKVQPAPIALPEHVDVAKRLVKALVLPLDSEPDQFPFENPVMQQHYRVLECLALEEDYKENAEEELFHPDYKGMSKHDTQSCMSAFNDCLNSVDFGEEEPASGKRRGGGGGGRAPKKSRLPEGDHTQYDWKAMAETGELSRLTIDNLKLYLRHFALRLSGKKGDLVARIEEHLVDTASQA